jgi:hypothetical protein
MKKLFTLMFVFLIGVTSLYAQTNCRDWNEYVDHKNTSSTGYYTLTAGTEELAAQTYHYSGPGNITDIRINGQIPAGIGGSFSATLKVSIYNVDANNRPTSTVSPSATQYLTWYFWQSSKTVHFGSGGIPVNNNFAVAVELIPYFSGQEFQVEYTGDGEGNNEDLPSVAGTATGGNWISTLPAKDGDLYIIPRMNHFITADFSASDTCNVAVNQSINFMDLSMMSTDRMFNTISLSGYTGNETLYHWDFGDASGTSTQQNPSYSYATPGVYMVTLTTTLDKWPMGGSACDDTKTLMISVGLDVTGTPTNLTCYNDNTGAIALTASGGDNSNYSYSLDGVTWQSSPNFTGLAAGTYSIYVQDGQGCMEAGSTVTLTEPAAIIIDAPISTTSATCGNTDGALLANASGGTGTLQYSLDNITYQASGSFSNLSGGSYTVYVKDANNCVTSANVAINNTSSPTLTLQSYTNVSCNGGNDGTITLIGSGGTGTLQYSIDGVTFQSTGNFTGVSAGTYTPIVQDAANCIGSLQCVSSCDVVITEPDAIDFSLSQIPTLCNGSSDGQIDVLGAIGGTGTLAYSVDGVNFQSGTHFTGLSAGLYTVTVKDVPGCIYTDTITVTEPDAIVVTITSTVDLSCFESHDGEITATATGGIGNYSYSLDGVNFFPSGDFFSLESGLYTITVQDRNGCTGTTTTTLNQPAEITATVTTGNSTCGNANGTILVVASGGSGSGYTYSIDGGVTSNGTGSFSGLVDSTYLVLVIDGSGCEEVFTAIVSDSDGPVIVAYTSTDVTCNGGNDGSITITSVTGGTGTIEYSVDGGPFQASNVLSGLSAGQHIVVIRDANGCTGEITVTLTEPSAFTIVLTGTNINCNGGTDGSITVSAAGGSGALAYSIDGINFQSTTVFNNLPAGNYVVTVKDAGQCTGTAFITLTEPDEIDLWIGLLNVTCYGGNDGAITVSATGGTGTIEFSLDGTNYQASGSFGNLTSANYVLFARDANGCIKTANITITQPSELIMSSTVSDVSCAGGDDGVIDITITGGTIPYTYNWSNLATTEDIFNLVAGSYSVIVLDANSCAVNDNFTVTEPSNPIIINGTVTDASGPTISDGSIDVTVTGGTAPYTYEWSNNDVTEDISFLAAGVYVIIITDANGCSHTASFIVSFSVGISELADENAISIYPNPAKDMIFIELGEKDKADRFVLIDMTGKIVYEEAPNSNKFEVDVKFLADGLYFASIYQGDNIITKKVVINR